MMIPGIHHITALASSPQENIDFYVGLLGLRLIKKTVNFDAPDIYHFYYGDENGAPGTILTFFPFPDALPGRRGNGEISSVALSIQPDSLTYWVDRLIGKGVDFSGPVSRYDAEVIAFRDPDGMQIELVTNSSTGGVSGWKRGAVDPAHATRGFYGVTMTTGHPEETRSFLGTVMKFNEGESVDGRSRFMVGQGSDQSYIEVVDGSGLAGARMSAGSVHHIAWRVANDSLQIAWRDDLESRGIDVTAILDRRYFHSIYFHEPGGVLFEIATDPPGFAIDELPDELGTSLRLPPWLENRRNQLERSLIPVNLPG